MARVSAAWRKYATLRQSRRRALAQGAFKYLETGEKRYLKRYNEFMRVSRSAIGEANRRMRALEKNGLDYGSPYNNLHAYIDSELNGVRRLPSATALASGKYNGDNDVQWFTATEQALKFLKSPISTVKGAESSNYYRVEKLKEMEAIPSEIEDSSTGELRATSWRDYEDFLRFLGSEEVNSSIDEYGESDLVVEMLWDYWNTDENNRGNNIKLMKIALSQYLAGDVSFDEAMRSRGLKIEDYIRRRQARRNI